MIRRALLRIVHTCTLHHRRYVLADRRRAGIVCFGCRATLPLPGDWNGRPTPYALWQRDAARDTTQATR